MRIFQLTSSIISPLEVEGSDSRLHFRANGSVYFAIAREKDMKHGAKDASLATVLAVENSENLQRDWLEKKIREMQSDDVFDMSFLAGIVFAGQVRPDTELSIEVRVFLKSLGCKWVRFVYCPSAITKFTCGPHIIHEGRLKQVFRLYDDGSGAFMSAFVPTKDPERFEHLNAAGKHYQTSSVAVPSRLADPNSGPLSGIRIAVKDLFHLKGLKNSLCSRAYYTVSPEAENTSPIISTLMQAGAVVVGVTKLSAFISKEEPTEAVDYQPPFNPRGDGYQSPAGSSSGSAVAVASYDWIDFAIGTDTSGSGRRPAMINGVYQLRPTHAAMSHEGMIPSFRPFDAPCLFGRDITKFEHFAKVWYAKSSPVCNKMATLPHTIIYPLDYLPVDNKVQMGMIDIFIHRLEQWTGSSAKKISIAEEWRRSPPPEASGQEVSSFLETANMKTFYHDFYHSTDSFRETYREMFHREPYVNDYIRGIWDIGSKVTREERDTAMSRLEVYRNWFLDTIFRPTQQNPLLILPISKVEPNYRNVPPSAKPRPNGFNSLYLPAILGGPDLVLPLGNFPYVSKITKVEEALPVAVNVVGAVGTDLNLINTMVRFLTDFNLPTQVSTGKTMF